MITDIKSTSPNIWVTQSNYSPYLNEHNNYNNNSSFHGAVRYKGNRFEIYDANANNWLPHIGNEVTISVDPNLSVVLDWAREKMVKEAKEEELLKKHPALQKAKENYDLIRILVENE